jgi:hypothetical protein
MSDSIEAEAAPRRLEFCCPTCLCSRIGYDTDRPPRCERCQVRMLADDLDQPRVRVHRERVMGAKRAPQ